MMWFKRQRWTLYLSASFILLMAVVPSALALPAAQDRPRCVDTECVGEPPPPTLPPVIVPQSASAQHQSSWGGYSDGRLNPDMAEYYSVWCKDNRIQVLRAVPSPQTSAEIPLAAVNGLSDGGTLVGANDVTVTRSGDSIILSGSNGNLAPQSGSKWFSLSQCNERNGGAPPTSQSTVAPIYHPALAPQNAGQDANASDTSLCADELYFQFHKMECGDAPDNGISLAWRLIDMACPGIGIVPTAFLSVVLFGSRRKRK